MITGYDLINSYYEDEKLYSTGNDYLDDLLEKAFCDGYNYAQKEFSSIKQTLEKKTKSDNMFISGFNKTLIKKGEKPFKSFDQFEKRNMKKSMRKYPNNKNNIISSYANTAFKNKGGGSPSTAHKLSSSDYLTLKH